MGQLNNDLSTMLSDQHGKRLDYPPYNLQFRLINRIPVRWYIHVYRPRNVTIEKGEIIIFYSSVLHDTVK